MRYLVQLWTRPTTPVAGLIPALSRRYAAPLFFLRRNSVVHTRGASVVTRTTGLNFFRFVFAS